MNNHIIEIAADVLKITVEEAGKYAKPIPEIEATYFWQAKRGGCAVIIDAHGEKLAAGSSVNFDAHVQAFREGKRN